MKTLNRSLLSFTLAILLVSPGCALFSADWQTTAGKLLASTALTVDASMQGWAKWVVAGQTTADQQAQVRSAYAKYQLAMSAAQSAYAAAVTANDQTVWTQASAALTAASGSLTLLIQSFTPQTIPIK